MHQRQQQQQCSPRTISLSLLLLLLLLLVNPNPTKSQLPGTWQLLVPNAGIASMHTAVTHYGTVLLLDRTDIGASKISLTDNRCRRDAADKSLQTDCSAHSVIIDVATAAVRPLTILTDTWCSSAQFTANGTLLHTGGDFDGNRKLRYFVPCPEPGACDWVESSDQSLKAGRWYATNQLLPDGRTIVVGGRDSFTLEFVPPSPGDELVTFPFLSSTRDMQMDNLYPYVHLLPDGNLFVFANRDSILYDYKRNAVLRKFPAIPGGPRNYPSGGSSVLLPLSAADGFTAVEVLICGGSQFGAFLNPEAKIPALDTCGRLAVSDPSPRWKMETMPFKRNMGDMVLLPSRDVLIINGAQAGSQGFGLSDIPCLNPVLYKPAGPDGLRFMVLNPSSIPRMYHSTANLLPDARVLIAGSNTHYYYTFTGSFPTELRVETFSPEYLSEGLASLRPTIIGSPVVLFYGLEFTVTVTVPLPVTGTLEVSLVSAPFTTHSYSQGQRLVHLSSTTPVSIGDRTYTVTGTGPPTGNLAPQAYYMLFVVNQGIPSTAVWVQVRE
ncbi:hypothetical protein SELMODRAFT_441651 [Selaginella moellendorffii]|uniref:Galactose oxidase-like Early set domain-containing protein n=1 Tax=Selaginella moellendorffii TaxID=88036 RepID=D8RLP0_SELML|nr:aldehyde oxidase GLOX [Selaginella moellendorffii]EFJ26956.1 hypothetical protein SELMODRAFT_441651 [Selaginella moellendorffii]|eukprot:XP_002972039.1 aldehyde oxidase GLOX [Selaginella moellendorffii]